MPAWCYYCKTFVKQIEKPTFAHKETIIHTYLFMEDFALGHKIYQQLRDLIKIVVLIKLDLAGFQVLWLW